MESEPSVGFKSSLPRPSRLPTPANRISQLPLPRQNGLQDPSRKEALRPTVEKRRSIAFLPRSTSPIKPVSTPTNQVNGNGGISKASKPVTRPPPGSSATVSKPTSRGNQQKATPPAAKTGTAAEHEENHDQLSSLDSFRSASRQGWHDESPIEPDLPQPGDTPAMRAKKSSRPSLSDRTIESLQGLPTTPKDRRQSNFFSPGGASMGPPLRPSSSLSRTGSNASSRPGTSDGSFGQPVGLSTTKRAPASARPAVRTSLGGFGFTPLRSVSGSSAVVRQSSRDSDVPPVPRSPSPSKHSVPVLSNVGASKITSGSKTFSGRSAKPRASMMGAFGGPLKTGSTQSAQSSSVKTATTKPNPESSPKGSQNAKSSSSALREQIAAAKAAARKERSKAECLSEHSVSSSSHGTHFETMVDPFNIAPKDGKNILRNRINAARMDGRLNIAAMDLDHIPDEVVRMYDSAAIEESNINWAEVVDLTKLIAADNRLEYLGDEVFPNVSVQAMSVDDDAQGSMFGDLELLDLHNNRLRAIPRGLGRLERLTSLNLAHNDLGNDALEVVSKLSTLKELRLGHNAFSGTLPSAMCTLRELKTLDIQANRLLALPDALRELVSLEVLNIASNQLTALPMDAIASIPLRELNASSNALISSLFAPSSAPKHNTLQTLIVANNSLAVLTFAEALLLPELRTLDVTNNHLAALPDLSGLPELITLTAGDNKMTQIPAGFTKLQKLRNVNFTGNELRLLDPEIAKMESLESLLLASNPLRDKKFLTMSAGDIKRDLLARVQPHEVDEIDLAEQNEASATGDGLLPVISSPRSQWLMQLNGRLDLSRKAYGDEINDGLGAFLQSNDVKQLLLAANKITCIPPALWLGQELRVLDLSGNDLCADYLSDDLELPLLQELNMSRCNISTPKPLLAHLQVPNLQLLNVAINRLDGAVPALRRAYPALTTFIAHDNRFTAVDAESLRGLHAVNLSSNNIEHLPPEIGLLWDEGLRSLEIGSNAFRVPNYRVLEKGTETMMKYLRDRIPEA